MTNQNNQNPYGENPYGHDSYWENRYHDGSSDNAFNANYGNNSFGSNAAGPGYAAESGYVAGSGMADPTAAKLAAWADPRFVSASLGQRLGAIIIDVIIIGTVDVALGLGIPRAFGTWDMEDLSPPFAFALATLISFVWIAYKVGMEATKGQTLGKMALGIRLVPIDGQPLGFSHSLKRNVNCFYPLIPVVGSFVDFVAWVGRFFSILNSPYNQGYHDGWGKVRVVRNFK